MEKIEIVRVHLFISGRVQGVYFRASVEDLSQELGLSGWARNLSDGRVEIVFEGEKEKVNKAIAWCHKGPPGAKVDEVVVLNEKPEGETGFRIKF